MNFTRRRFLKAAGVTLALPWLESSTARADTTPPARLVLVFTPNGTLKDRWVPTAPASLSPILDPLQNFRSRLSVITNVDMLSTQVGSGDGHQKGIGHLWTGTALQPGQLFGTVDWAGGPSIDQRVAEVIGTGTTLRSLELGVQVPGSRVYDRMIYRAAGQPVPAIVDPRETFARIFGTETDPQQAQLRKVRRKSVLDAVLREFNQVQNTVSASDARRLDAHASTIREVEQRLDRLPLPLNACVKPAVPQVDSLTAGDAYPHLGQLQTDLLALALACDVTHVASLQWSSASSPVVFSWLQQKVDHHELSHRADGDLDARAQIEQIDHWYAEQFARLLTTLQAAGEGGGSLLDNTLVVWGNELGKGNQHTHDSVPFVVAGNIQNRINSGINFDAQHQSHSKLLLSCAQACGLPDTSFGDPQFGTGPLAGILKT